MNPQTDHCLFPQRFLARAAPILFLLLLTPLFGGLSLQADESSRWAAEYPYGSPEFTEFIRDSYREAGGGDEKLFYDWLENAYRLWKERAIEIGSFPIQVPLQGKENGDFREFLGSIRQGLLPIQDPSTKAEEELTILQWAHQFIKAIIPRFSLQRGYEFTSVVTYGERQCVLQSVLMAGLLQKTGLDAGVVMISRNQKGEETNNGHAAVLARLSNGNHIIVDASHGEPFVPHQGIFARDPSGYRYLTPAYGTSLDSDAIDHYQYSGSSERAENSQVSGLDIEFLHSQFDIYRGEWVPGSLHEQKKTSEGLEKAAGYFQRSVKRCPENPLALYFLARAYEEMREKEEARRYFVRALEAYTQYGWVPQGLEERLSKLKEGSP